MEGIRVLHFAKDRSLGMLQVRDWGVSGGWQWLADARGDVTAPNGKEIRLKISAEGATDLSPLASLEFDDVQWVDLSHAKITDEDLLHLQSLTMLRRLDLRSTPIGNAALNYIKNLTLLKELRLNGTRISDDGLAYLKDMAKLENLWLLDTLLTDGAILHLKGITSLEVVQLPRQITHAAVANLKQALPRCYINVQH